MVKIGQFRKEENNRRHSDNKIGDAINNILKKEIRIKGKFFNDKAKNRFFSEMSILLDSGIDIHTAFEIIIDGVLNKEERNVFSSIRDSIIDGNSFYEALNKSGKFSQYDIASIKIGEETGTLSKILVELSIYYERKIKQRRLLFKAISYPIIVLLTAIGAMIFMLSFVVPMFEEIFFRSNKELPVFTKYIISLSKFFRDDSIYIFGFILLIIGVVVLFSKSSKTQETIGKIVLKIPILGNILKLFYLEKLYHSFAILISAKVPVHDAVKLVMGIIGFVPINKALKRVSESVMGGNSLARSMEETGFFEKKALVLIRIGEEVNKLDEIFDKLYNQVSDKLEHYINQLGNTLEPLLIIFVGAFVALILIAMYLPIFQLGTSVF